MRDAGLHQRQSNQVPAVERQVRDLSLIHDPAQGTVRCLDQRRLFGYGNGLAWRSHFQNEFNRGFLPNLQCDTRPGECRESFLHHVQPIVTDRQRWKPVGTVFSRGPSASQRGIDVGYRYINPWDYRAAGIFHHAQNCPRRELSKNQAGWHCDQCNNRCYECLKRTQTDTQYPYHIPLLSNFELRIRKQIWQASRRSLPAFI